MAMPYLNIPIVRQLVEFLIKKVYDIVYTELDLHGNYIAIDFKTEIQKRRYDKAVRILDKAIEENQNIEKAKDEYKKAFRNIINFN